MQRNQITAENNKYLRSPVTVSYGLINSSWQAPQERPIEHMNAYPRPCIMGQSEDRYSRHSSSYTGGRRRVADKQDYRLRKRQPYLPIWLLVIGNSTDPFVTPYVTTTRQLD